MVAVSPSGLPLLITMMFLIALSGCVIAQTGQKPVRVYAGDARSLLFWNIDAGTPEQRFELAKSSVPELTAFLLKMPKGADLHNHVSGATYSEYLLLKGFPKFYFYPVICFKIRDRNTFII